MALKTLEYKEYNQLKEKISRLESEKAELVEALEEVLRVWKNNECPFDEEKDEFENTNLIKKTRTALARVKEG